ncbi:receptor-like serine/threonine-protein kinase SD1-8 [Tanacetum coccineum]
MNTGGFPEVLIWSNGTESYWSGAWNGKRLAGVPEMKSSSNTSIMEFEFLDTSDEISYSFEMLNSSVYSRLVISSSCFVKRFTWINTTQTWSMSSFAPRDQCDYYKRCGPYGICDTNYYPVCKCMKGFVPKIQQAWDLGDGSDGCVRSSKLDCRSDGFFKLKNMKSPDSSKVFVDQTMNLTTCGVICKRNCSYAAYANMDVTEGGSDQGIEELRNEVQLIAKLQHRNLVRLLGCCIEVQEKLFVYEYMEHKSLNTFIFDKEKGAQLNWEKSHTLDNCHKPNTEDFNIGLRSSEVKFPINHDESASVNQVTITILDGRSANRDTSLTSVSGSLAIGEDGNVIILDEVENMVWSSNQSFVGVNRIVAQLLDSGNFVIRRENDENPSNYLWQSFENPTDTLLPGMKLGGTRTGMNTFCSSWKTNVDPGSGDSSVKKLNHGWLPEVLIWSKGTERYRSGAWNGKRLGGVPEMKSSSNTRIVLSAAVAYMDVMKAGSGWCDFVGSGFIDMRQYVDSEGWWTRYIYISVPASDLVPSSTTTRASGKGSGNHLVMIVAITAGVSTVIIVLVIILLLVRWKKTQLLKNSRIDRKEGNNVPSKSGSFEIDLPLFDFTTLVMATKDFSNENKLGHGGFGPLFFTSGYIAPEYAMDGLFSIKSDVFSFGVLLLEIVSGKRNRGFYFADNQLNLLGHTWKLWSEGNCLELLDESVGAEFSRDEYVGQLPQPRHPGFNIGLRSYEVKFPINHDESASVNQVTITILDGR